jgi:hypothetical protein
MGDGDVRETWLALYQPGTLGYYPNREGDS